MSESLTQVISYVEHLLAINPELRLLGYDDWCHLDRLRARHANPQVRTLAGFIDRFHAKGHRRVQCWSRFHADSYELLWEFSQVEIRANDDMSSWLASLRRDPHLEIHHIFGVASPSAPPARILAEALQGLLPMFLTFRSDGLAEAPAAPGIWVRSEGGRDRVLRLIQRGSLRLREALRGSGWDVPAGSRLHSVRATGAEVISGLAQGDLRVLLATAPLPAIVILRRRRNTQVCEQRWRALNKAARTLQHLAPIVFDFLLARLIDAQNARIAACRRT
jgi:hypothetical protein